MQTDVPFDVIPLGALFVLIVGATLIAAEVGFRLGRRRSRLVQRDEQTPIGSIVGATLGLFAFMLAFTFGMAATRYETRKQLLLDEVNAIGTTYLRSQYLAEPQRAEIQKLLREYVDVRLEAVKPGKLAEGIATSERLQDKIWAQAVTVAKENPRSVVAGLFIESLNEVIDLHAKRVTAGLRNRIPESIWSVLGALAVLSMATMGYHAGLTGTRSPVVNSAMLLAFAVVIILIADLDRPREGLIRVSQQSLVDLQSKLNETAP